MLPARRPAHPPAQEVPSVPARRLPNAHAASTSTPRCPPTVHSRCPACQHVGRRLPTQWAGRLPGAQHVGCPTSMLPARRPAHSPAQQLPSVPARRPRAAHPPCTGGAQRASTSAACCPHVGQDGCPAPSTSAAQRPCCQPLVLPTRLHASSRSSPPVTC